MVHEVVDLRLGAFFMIPFQRAEEQSYRAISKLTSPLFIHLSQRIVAHKAYGFDMSLQASLDMKPSFIIKA